MEEFWPWAYTLRNALQENETMAFLFIGRLA